MSDIMTHVDRLQELSGLLVKMCQEPDFKKFCELDKQFKDIIELNKIEDELNVDCNSTSV